MADEAVRRRTAMLGRASMTMTMNKWVYAFGGGTADGRAEMRNLLGGKGANLAEMSRLGLPVPPGFTITTDVCTYFYDHGKQYPSGLTEHVAQALAGGEGQTGMILGGPSRQTVVGGKRWCGRFA